MSYFVYLLRCGDGSLYCGITNNIEKRLAAHNSSKRGAKYTRTRQPVKLVYSESFLSKSTALQREYEIKKLSKSQKEALITSVK